MGEQLFVSLSDRTPRKMVVSLGFLLLLLMELIIDILIRDIKGFKEEETPVIDDEKLLKCDWSVQFSGVKENWSIGVSERVHVFRSYSVNASRSKNHRYVCNLILSSLGVFGLFFLGENQVSSLFY